MRESLLQGLLLSAAGGLLGLGLAFTAIRTALHLLPDSLPRIDSISLDGTVASFAILVALASGVLCSLAPAFAAVRTNLMQSLKEGAQTGTGAEADLFKYLIRDLSTGGIIRQARETDYHGRFLRKDTRGRPRTPSSAVMESAFEEIKPYVLTELGKQFVHYVMDDVVPQIGGSAQEERSV